MFTTFYFYCKYCKYAVKKSYKPTGLVFILNSHLHDVMSVKLWRQPINPFMNLWRSQAFRHLDYCRSLVCEDTWSKKGSFNV